MILARRPTLILQAHRWQRPSWWRGRRGWRLCLGWLSVIGLGRALTGILAELMGQR